jgi:hypothetical protein
MAPIGLLSDPDRSPALRFPLAGSALRSVRLTLTVRDAKVLVKRYF